MSSTKSAYDGDVHMRCWSKVALERPDNRKEFPPCEYMAKKTPGARLGIIAGAGHSANLDQPSAFNRVLRDFLGGLPA